MGRAKICGLTREADVDAAVDAGADAVGFVVDVPVDTPREVTPERAAALAARVPPFVTTVLVTMPSDPRDAIDLVETVAPDAIQCHGDLPPGDVAFVRSRVDARVITAVDAADVAVHADTAGGEPHAAASEAGDPDAVRRYADVSDALLVDSLSADGAGGTGETHDWTRTRDVIAELSVPVILAGGLTPANVATAIDVVDPFAVDVASGVEARGGVKDHDRVRAFVDAVANATPERVVSP